MKITLDPRKNLLENIVHYREEAKKYRSKAAGAEKALTESLAVQKEQKLEEVQQSEKAKREWYSNFHHFTTQSRTLVVGGRNAKQNDTLFTKHCAKGEWFLHAEIRGAPAVIVKNPNASEGELQEAAQFAASYSSAWKRQFGNIDVYAVRCEQVSKHFQGGFLDQGAFAIAGERKWFKNTLLELYICLNAETLQFTIRPAVAGPTNLCIKVKPGPIEKNAAAKAIKTMFAKKLFAAGKRVKLDEEEIVKLLPGNCNMG